MSEIIITAEVRKTGKAGALRRTGKVPGIYYGHGQANVAVAIEELTLKPLYATTATHIINLKLEDGSTHPCILKAIDFDPVSERPVHFDLFGLNPNEEVTLEVPVKLTGGVPQGVKDGGILQHVLHRLRVSCLPKNIPDHLEVDVATLGLNKSIHVGDIQIPNVRVLEDARSTVVAVVPPVIEKEPEVVAADVVAAPAEPEVIGKGKKPEEEGEAPKAEKGAEKAEKPEKDEKPEKKPEKK